jgi:hypothetical protein
MAPCPKPPRQAGAVRRRADPSSLGTGRSLDMPMSVRDSEQNSSLSCRRSTEPVSDDVGVPVGGPNRRLTGVAVNVRVAPR